ncbi:hypothetical protein FEM48_Zijuj06G0011200 [Ziziphus jujuba var. spinosa]|uniref:Replication factor A C-terminal domain-containing protein n=1 Tax=Ziziphus jujuba var. spinosa TaxID=714518 RepID=A0A978V6A6_ZIZJJ|nr:hypothetical protein FEM48_Zijuj06G0011200 [Ziziphus jujuba var. spinosa]
MVREVKLIKDIQAQQRDVIGIAIEIKPKKEIITNDGLEIVQEMTLMNDKYNANAEKAMDIICGRIGLETKSLSTLPSAEDIITIKMIDNQLNTRFNCLYCRHDQVKAMPRCRVIVDLIDEYSSLNATLFGNQAEKFLGCTAYELMNKSDGDSVKDIEKITTLSSSHKLLIQVKASKHEYRDITRWKYTILSVCNTISKEINTSTQTDTSNDAEVSQVLEIVEEQSGKSLGITELREQMSNEDKVLADLVSKPTARNNATKKLKLMISKSAGEADPIALNLESSHLQFGEGNFLLF